MTSAEPFIRNVSSTLGIRNNKPILGCFKRFNKPSIRLFPGRSGITNVFLSNTVTKPAGSPLGDTSKFRPSDVAKTQNVEFFIKLRQLLINIFET